MILCLIDECSLFRESILTYFLEESILGSQEVRRRALFAFKREKGGGFICLGFFEF